jgi:ferredoxin
MDVRIDPDLCEGHGVCMVICPEVFDLGDDDETRVLIPRPAADLLPQVIAAAEACPKAAIRLSEPDATR